MRGGADARGRLPADQRSHARARDDVVAQPVDERDGRRRCRAGRGGADDHGRVARPNPRASRSNAWRVVIARPDVASATIAASRGSRPRCSPSRYATSAEFSDEPPLRGR
jgi:hypothetical protein